MMTLTICKRKLSPNKRQRCQSTPSRSSRYRFTNVRKSKNNQSLTGNSGSWTESRALLRRTSDWFPVSHIHADRMGGKDGGSRRTEWEIFLELPLIVFVGLDRLIRKLSRDILFLSNQDITGGLSFYIWWRLNLQLRWALLWGLWKPYW